MVRHLPARVGNWLYELRDAVLRVDRTGRRVLAAQPAGHDRHPDGAVWFLRRRLGNPMARRDRPGGRKRASIMAMARLQYSDAGESRLVLHQPPASAGEQVVVIRAAADGLFDLAAALSLLAPFLMHCIILLY